jgi:hypothetical protein
MIFIIAITTAGWWRRFKIRVARTRIALDGNEAGRTVIWLTMRLTSRS